MDLPITLLKSIKPFKTSWRIQVKILHSWKQYTTTSGETMEMILADEEGTKILASVKKEFVKKYERYLPTGEWKVITNIKLTHAVGEYRPTAHAYKIGFVKETFVNNTVNVSDSLFLATINFKKIKEDYNQSFLCDVLGQVINVKELEILGTATKPLKKLEFELRDETDERLGCTLWNSMAEEMSAACESAGDESVICLLRFSKIREFKGVKSASNAFSTSLLQINPNHHEIEEFKTRLPDDGLAITLSESKPQLDVVFGNDYWKEQQNITIAELKQSTEVGKAKIMCTIYAIDTDWGWFYIGCTKRNHKKVEQAKANSGLELIQGKGKKPMFWCDMCDANVSHVAGKYKIHVKVKDQTTTTTLLLFDGFAKEVINKTANELLNGNFNEIEDPEDIPEEIKNLCGKTFQFGVQIDKENLRGHDTFKVTKVVSNSEMLEDNTVDGDKSINAEQPISGNEETLLITNTEEINESKTTDVKTTSLKRKDEKDVVILDQQSTTKKLRLEDIKVENVKMEQIKEENGKV